MSEPKRQPGPSEAPTAGPTYRMDRPFEWNAAHGPAYDGPWPAVPETPLTDFLGLPVRSTFGVAASLLVNETWVRTYARLGFDLLTYKTVRSEPWPSHPMPNWLPLTSANGLEDPEAAYPAEGGMPDAAMPETLAGSLGMPSQAPAVWREDIGRCRAALDEGQILMVSIVATVRPGMTREEVVTDFRALASEVVAAGAQAVEGNLSCPNVSAREGELFRDPALSGEVARAIRSGAGDVPVLLKIGHLAEDEVLRDFLRGVADSADAVTMVNGLSRRIFDAAGAPAFGPGRERAGIIGAGLRPLALDQVRRSRAMIEADGLPLDLVGVGGVSAPEHVAAFEEAGAVAVQTASAAAWDPSLAIRVKQASG